MAFLYAANRLPLYLWDAARTASLYLKSVHHQVNKSKFSLQTLEKRKCKAEYE